MKSAFFNFTRFYFGQHDAKLPKGWSPDATDLNEFHDYLLKQNYDFTEAEFTQDTDWIKRFLKREMYITAFNLDESERVAVETDPEVEQAIDAMPKAKALLDSARKVVVKRMQPEEPVARQVKTAAQIVVLDAGGQYCHLIARKVRDLGVYSEVRPSETPAADLAGAKGLIISGGPNSVYDPSSPTVDPAIFQNGARVLGICYGQQLMAHLLGGTVQLGDKGEYGLATLDLLANGTGSPSALFDGISGRQQIWMSHRDLVSAAPPGFSVLGSTATCAIAAIEAPARGLYAVQFHPEVAHTTRGREILSNFLFGICGCRRDWDPRHRVPQIEDEIRQCVGDRNVFFFVSGGVDSTVACALCQRALGAGARARRLCRYRADARRRNRFRAPHAGPLRRVRRRRSFWAPWPACAIPSGSATSSAKNSCACRSASSNPATCWTAIGFWARAPFIRIPSNPAAPRRPPSSRRITTACPASRG